MRVDEWQLADLEGEIGPPMGHPAHAGAGSRLRAVTMIGSRFKILVKRPSKRAKAQTGHQ